MTAEVTVAHCRAVYDAEIAAGALTNREALESALAAPFHGVGDQELFPTIYEKAARLGFGICQAHAYQDGNKRLAWMMTVVFLSLNGITLEVDQDEAAHVVLAVASGGCSYEEYLFWLTECVLPTAVDGAVAALDCSGENRSD